MVGSYTDTLLNTSINYYTYTNDLKHNNTSIVKFPVLNISSHWKPQISFPFEVTSNDHNILKLKLDGWYQIIYCDNIKYGSQFVIYNRTQNINIYSILFAYNDFYTPFCVNSIFKITINKNISNHIAIQLKLNKLVSFKDVRANCYCASLLRTKIHATSSMSARALSIKINNDREYGHYCSFAWI